MIQPPRAWGTPTGCARIRCHPEDFRVSENLGFEPSGDGEHVFLHLEKRQLNTMDVVRHLSALSGVSGRQIGYCGLKDRNAVTRQWFSVGLAGRSEPDWRDIEQRGDVQVLAVQRHRKKLKRGVHSGNRFTLLLRQVEGERAALESRLRLIQASGVPNYFGEQRFGRNGSTYEQALRWMRAGRRVPREKRSLYLSALRAYVFNGLLAQRVGLGTWAEIQSGDVSLLHGTRSFFVCDSVDEDIRNRVAVADLHPGLPLWGKDRGKGEVNADLRELIGAIDDTDEYGEICDFLEAAGAALAWRATRLVPDDFCWRFCDDDTLQLDFALGAGSYATALLAEFVQYEE